MTEDEFENEHESEGELREKYKQMLEDEQLRHQKKIKDIEQWIVTELKKLYQ